MSLPPGATLVSGQVPMRLPAGATLVSGNAPQQQPSTPPTQPAQQPDSFWRQVYDSTPILSLGKAASDLSQWAQGKANQKANEDLGSVAQGAPAKGFAEEAVSPRAGYDLLARTSGLVSSFLTPKNLAITGGVIAANTNPFTGVPVDAALVGHGAYGVYKNAPGALAGNPDAEEGALLSASEMVGGAAGLGEHVTALRTAVGMPSAPAQASAAQPSASASAQAGASLPDAATQGSRIAQTLGISDPPPNQLLTKAIKPLASNTGWDSAIAKAAPDMKAAEADLGHPITGVDDALNAVSIAKKGIWQQYEDKLGAASTGFGDEETGATIDGNDVADAMMNSIDKRTQLQNPDLVERIGKIADTYRRPMGLDEAEDFLQSANNDLHSYYAKNKVGRQVAANDPATGYVVAEADQLRDSLYSALDDLTGEGAADLKQRYGALSNVENELLRRKNVAARQQPDSLAEQLSMARAYGKIAVGVARMSPSSLLEGTQSLAAAKWLKARGTTDAMIQRAFQSLGQQPSAAAPSPDEALSPEAISGISAATGGAASGGTRLSDLSGGQQ